MIVEHSERGEIFHVMSTHAPGIADRLREMGRRFIELPAHPGYDALNLGHVIDGELRARPHMGVSIDKTEIAADGIDKATVSEIPLGATVFVDDVPSDHIGHTLELTSDMPATYRIKIEHWPALPFEIEVTAV